MLFTLKSKELTVTLNDLGAEIVSAKCAEDCEYMWQGDPEYWAGRAPILFPICGRLFGGHYTYEGKEYEMNIHGFARHSTFEAKQTDDCNITFTLYSSEETKKIYPFDFELTVKYALCGNKLSSSITVKNTSDKVLPAAIGLHPGFNVPLDSGNFEDWYLEFDKTCSPDELVFTDTCFMTGKKKAYPLVDGKILPLRHSLFDIDAIFLSNTDNKVTLRSDKSDRYINFSFPEFRYLGVWHKPRTQAPYVCIEPWCGLPTFDGEIDDFSQKCDMFRLIPNDTKTLDYSIIFG